MWIFGVIIALRETILDLLPPFISNENNEIGSWRFSGSSTIYEKFIHLVTPTQYHKGSAFSKVKISGKDWSFLIDLSISEGNGGGEIQFILYNGKDVQINESIDLSDFNTLMLKGVIDKEIMHLHFLEKYSFFNNTIRDKSKYFDVSINNQSVKLYFEKKNDKVTIYNANNYSESLKYFSTTSFMQSYLEIKALSNEYTSLFTLNALTFDIPNTTTLFQKDDNFPYDQEHTTPSYKFLLRNPIFISLRTEISEYEKAHGSLQHMKSTTVFEVLNVIDEIKNVTKEVSTFNNLMNFVEQTLIPYTTSWQRRASKIIGYVTDSKDVAKKMIDKAVSLQNDVSLAKEDALKKTDEAFESLASSFSEELAKSSDFDTEFLITEFKNKSIENLLLFSAIIEVGVFIVISTILLKRRPKLVC